MAAFHGLDVAVAGAGGLGRQRRQLLGAKVAVAAALGLQAPALKGPSITALLGL